jgi:crotonobetainyl-CoA:carnitine CoA-transferase CaiB-like acyl-CoA transferase
VLLKGGRWIVPRTEPAVPYVEVGCVCQHPPALGEHTRSVLRAGGFPDAEIDALIECGKSA